MLRKINRRRRLMAFRIKKYPPKKKARKLPLVGFGQGSRDLTRGKSYSAGAGGATILPITTTTTTTSTTSTTSTTTTLAPAYYEEESMGQTGASAHTNATAAFNKYVSHRWTAGATYTLRRITLRLDDDAFPGGGNDTKDWIVEIRDHDGSNPGSVLATGIIPTGTIQLAPDDYDIDFDPGASIVDTNLYCVVLYPDGASNAGIRVYYDQPDTELAQQDADDAGSWATFHGTMIPRLKTYSYS